MENEIAKIIKLVKKISLPLNHILMIDIDETNLGCRYKIVRRDKSITFGRLRGYATDDIIILAICEDTLGNVICKTQGSTTYILKTLKNLQSQYYETLVVLHI